MINLESLGSSDPEPEPSPEIERSGIYLLPTHEHHESDDASVAGVYANKETINTIAQSILVLTDLIPEQTNGSIYSRQKTVGSPFHGMVRVSKYGFFDPSVHDSPAKQYFLEKLKPRVAGIEIHHPISVNAEGEVEHTVESYLIEEGANKEYILQALIYDPKTNSEENVLVSQNDAIELLALLQILHSNE